MSDSTVSVTVTGTTGVHSVTIDFSYGQNTSLATVEVDSTTLSVNDYIEIDVNYEGEPSAGALFVGYVKIIEYKRPDGTVTITAKDVLIRAVDYFIAADDPDNPRSYEDIRDADLIKTLLIEDTGIGGSHFHSLLPDTPYFTFGTNGPAKFNLMSAWDAANQIAQILAYDIYADSGEIYLANTKPYIQVGDAASYVWITGNTGKITEISHEMSDKNLRNKVVVYGKTNDDGGIKASASGSSPYLPTGFFKAAVIANELIDTQAMAQAAADYNLAVFNRLTETVNLQILGNKNVKPRQFATITESVTQTSSLWFIHTVNHIVSDSGYITRVMATR